MPNNIKIKEISERTGISVKELNRLNQDLWYHGTTIEDAKNIKVNGVSVDYNHGASLDFGPGFYMTDTFQRASNYISRVPIIIPGGGLEECTSWAVIEFVINPFDLLFSGENQYSYRNFPKHDEKFAKFVFENRMNNTHNENPHNCDIIWGVMSDSNPEQIVWDYKSFRLSYDAAIKLLQKTNSMKQLFIGNQDICNMLVVNNIYVKEGNGDARKIDN